MVRGVPSSTILYAAVIGLVFGNLQFQLDLLPVLVLPWIITGQSILESVIGCLTYMHTLDTI